MIFQKIYIHNNVYNLCITFKKIGKTFFFFLKSNVYNVNIYSNTYPHKENFPTIFFQPPINVEKSVDINIILWTTSFEFLEYLY